MHITQTKHRERTTGGSLAEYATGPARLLLVTGNALYARLLLGNLAELGFAVTVAESAVAALRLRQDGAQFELVMVDIDLPDMDALAFARTVRAGGQWSEQALVAVSVCPEPRRRRAEAAAGFLRHVAIVGDECLEPSPSV